MSGERHLNSPSLIRRLTLCKIQACPFASASDEYACWGQCTICGKVSGYVTRKSIRLYMDTEDAARGTIHPERKA